MVLPTESEHETFSCLNRLPQGKPSFENAREKKEDLSKVLLNKERDPVKPKMEHIFVAKIVATRFLD